MQYQFMIDLSLSINTATPVTTTATTATTTTCSICGINSARASMCWLPTYIAITSNHRATQFCVSIRATPALLLLVLVLVLLCIVPWDPPRPFLPSSLIQQDIQSLVNNSEQQYACYYLRLVLLSVTSVCRLMQKHTRIHTLEVLITTYQTSLLGAGAGVGVGVGVGVGLGVGLDLQTPHQQP